MRALMRGAPKVVGRLDTYSRAGRETAEMTSRSNKIQIGGHSLSCVDTTPDQSIGISYYVYTAQTRHEATSPRIQPFFVLAILNSCSRRAAHRSMLDATRLVYGYRTAIRTYATLVYIFSFSHGTVCIVAGRRFYAFFARKTTKRPTNVWNEATYGTIFLAQFAKITNKSQRYDR
jgi:hypothetical protein